MNAWMFPGQGSQRLGMGADLETEPARQVFEAASEVLGWDVRRTCLEGPEERLNSTEVTQPAVFTVGVAVARTLEAFDVQPDMVAGHSVGEFTALVAAGVLTFEDGLRSVALRAEAMRRAGRRHPGGMAAVMGMVPQRLEEICAEADGIVGPANFNAPQQIVISGENDALAGVAAAAKAEGARVIRLKVSVAAHSALMRPARDELAAALQHVSTKGPRVPVVSGVDGRVHEDAAELLRLLVEGVTRPVRWVECVETMAANGAGRFVETGPGEVLSGLVKRIVPGAQLAQVGDDTAAESLAKELAAVGGGADGHRV